MAFALLVAGTGPSTAGNGDCGQPISDGSGPSASDCNYMLKVAVGSEPCAMCVCDVNGSNSLTTGDALFCLKKAVGQPLNLDCPSCSDTTTTTVNGPPTTSTSTTSTTTTIPVKCVSEGDCSDLPDAFRCNPNTETCEKPCTKNTECKDFYECNKTTGYCQEPAAQF